jgi:UDP-3-O-[3-hydroxymyristoyl] glucosamine N-acyltransferase
MDFYIGDKETFKIGEGNIIVGSCAVTCNVSIGNFNLLNGAVVMGHDSTLGDYNVIMPGTRISGEVSIGNRNLLGSMSFVKQQLTIKDDVTLSPLSALLTKPKSGCTYIGNPAKIFKY